MRLKELGAITSNTFRNKGQASSKISAATFVAMLIFILLIFVTMTDMMFYMWRHYFNREPEYKKTVIVINAPDDFVEYTKDISEFFFIFDEHPYRFDVSYYYTLMNEYSAELTVFFPENFDKTNNSADNDVVTYFPLDSLEYSDFKEYFINNYLGRYSNIRLSSRGIPIANNSPVNYEGEGVFPNNYDNGLNAVLKSLAIMLVPLLLFITVLYSSMSTGTNAVAGSKEQNTFAALLMTPVSRRTIVIGHTLGVWLKALIPALLLSLSLLFIPMYRGGVVATIFHIAALSFFIASLTIMISVLNNSVITAQTTFLPIFLIFIVLCVTCMQSVDSYDYYYYFLPFYGQYLGIATALTEEVHIAALIVSSILTIGLGIICIYISEKLLYTERFTVASTSSSDKELQRIKRQQQKELTDYVSKPKAKIYGYVPKKRTDNGSFILSELLRPLGLLGIFQFLSLVPPLLFTDGAGLTDILESLREVNTIDGVLNSTLSLMGVIMSTPSFLMSMSLGYLCIILTYIVKVKHLDKDSLSTIGFPNTKVVRRYLIGLLIGGSMIAAVYGLLMALGQIKVASVGLPSDKVLLFLAFIAMWIPQGATEEIMFRGFMFSRVGARYGIFWAYLSSSLLFCLFHGMNPGFSVLALINLILISILYALIAQKTGHIWTVCAAHTMWNFTQGNIFGLEVSGNAGNTSVISSALTVKASAFWTGGGFGPEGGFAVTIVVVIAIGITLLIFRNKKDCQES